MSLTEEQRARMERMKKVAQEKKKWKEKATHSGGGNSGAASGGQADSVRGGCGVALQTVQSGGGQGVHIASVQAGGLQKIPVVVERVCQQDGIAKSQQSSITATASSVPSGSSVASVSSSNGSGSSNHQSSIAGRAAPTFCGGSVATKPALAFYKPQAQAPPPLPRGNFRPQEQPSAFKHQAPSKVSYPNHVDLAIF